MLLHHYHHHHHQHHKVALLDLLLTVSTIEPISLALFLGVPKNGADRNLDKENSSSLVLSQHTATPNSSAIVTMIEELLNKVLY